MADAPFDASAVRDRLLLWLFTRASGALDLKQLVQGWCEALVACDLPVDRFFMATRTLHPQAFGYGVRWVREQGEVALGRALHDDMAQHRATSPIDVIVATGAPLRFRLDDGLVAGWSDLEALRDLGYTDWYAQVTHFQGRPVGPMAYTTRRAGGFTQAHLDVIDAVSPALDVLIQVRGQRDVMMTVLSTYLGADAGGRVLAGQVRRGDGQQINAALWMSDLRDFTGLADRLPMAELLSLLNDAFERQVEAVQSNGGEVLKFIGDGMLAIFPVTAQRTPAVACASALTAARSCVAAIGTLNAARETAARPLVRMGLALHFGDVMFGNIGGRDRLDFTVIGPAVNRSARLEALSKPLGRQVLASAEFAALCAEPLEPLGTHPLKGVEGTHPVFAVPLP